MKLPDGSRAGLRLTVGIGGGIPSCPSPTGTIAGGESGGGAFTSDTTKDGLRVTETASFSAKRRVDTSLDEDAQLQPIRFSTTVTLDHARSLRQGPLRVVTRLVGRGTYSGTIDPRSGAVSGGEMTVTVTASGFLDDAAAKAAWSKTVEEALRTDVERILAAVQKVEARARGGECTRLVFTPASPR